jgi:hypothetical protein
MQALCASCNSFSQKVILRIDLDGCTLHRRRLHCSSVAQSPPFLLLQHGVTHTHTEITCVLWITVVSCTGRMGPGRLQPSRRFEKASVCVAVFVCSCNRGPQHSTHHTAHSTQHTAHSTAQQDERDRRHEHALQPMHLSGVQYIPAASTVLRALHQCGS